MKILIVYKLQPNKFELKWINTYCQTFWMNSGPNIFSNLFDSWCILKVYPPHERSKKNLAPKAPWGKIWGHLYFDPQIRVNLKMWLCGHILHLGQKIFWGFCTPLRGLQKERKKFRPGSIFNQSDPKMSFFRVIFGLQ